MGLTLTGLAEGSKRPLLVLTFITMEYYRRWLGLKRLGLLFLITLLTGCSTINSTIAYRKVTNTELISTYKPATIRVMTEPEFVARVLADTIKYFETRGKLISKNGYIGYGFSVKAHKLKYKTLTKEQADRILDSLLVLKAKAMRKRYPNADLITLTHLAYWRGVSGASRCLNKDGSLNEELLMRQLGKYKRRVNVLLAMTEVR